MRANKWRYYLLALLLLANCALITILIYQKILRKPDASATAPLPQGDERQQQGDERQQEAQSQIKARFLSSVELHEKMRDVAETSKQDKVVAVFFSSVCSACPANELVNLLNDYSKRGKGVKVISFFPVTYTRQDLKSFNANLQPQFASEIVSPALSAQWSAITQIYEEKYVNGTVVIFNQGRLRIAYGLAETKAALDELLA
jgi:hypothetical protein